MPNAAPPQADAGTTGDTAATDDANPFPIGSRALLTDLPQDHAFFAENGSEGTVVDPPSLLLSPDGDDTAAAAADHDSNTVRYVRIQDLDLQGNVTCTRIHAVSLQHLRVSNRPFPVGSRVQIQPHALPPGPMGDLMRHVVGVVVGYNDNGIRLVEFTIGLLQGEPTVQAIPLKVEQLVLATDENDNDEDNPASEPPIFPVGTRVALTGIEHNPHLNGMQGVVVEVPSDGAAAHLARRVQFDDPEHTQVMIPLLNLQEAPDVAATAETSSSSQVDWSRAEPAPATAPQVDNDNEPEEFVPGMPTNETTLQLLQQLADADPDELRREAQRVLAMPRSQWEANLGGVPLQEEQYQMFRQLWTLILEHPERVQAVLNDPQYTNRQEGRAEAMFRLVVMAGSDGDDTEETTATATTATEHATAADNNVVEQEEEEEEEEYDDPRLEEFFFAVENWLVADVVELMEQDPRRVHQKQVTSRKRMTALHLASSRDRTPTLSVLLKYGADCTAKDGDKCTALHLAAQFDCLAAGQMLIDEAGADPNAFRIQHPEREPKHVTANTPLENAVMEGHVDFCRMLLETKRIPQETLDESMFCATITWSVPCARLLLEHGANVNATLPRSTMTVFHFACGSGQEAFVKLLLDFGVDLTIKDEFLTGLDLAISQERHNVVHLIQTSEQYSEDMENALFKKYKQVNATAYSSCHGCATPDPLAKEWCYKCLSCQKESGETHIYCSTCVLGAAQKANQICPNHVLALTRTNDSNLALNPGEKLRGTYKRQSADKIHNVCCRKWLQTSPSSDDDSFGLYQKVKTLTRSTKDTKAMVTMCLTEVPSLVDVYTQQQISAVNRPAVVDQLSDALVAQYKTDNIAVDQMSNAFASVSPQGSRLFLRDLAYWIRTRAGRPSSGLPSWVALLGGCQDVSPHAISDVVALLVFSKLLQEMSILQRPERIKDYLTSGNKKGDPPTLYKTLVGELPVAVLPGTVLFLHDRMPEHGDCQWEGDNDDASANMLPTGPTLKLFISHGWRAPEHPDKDGIDWMSLRDFLFALTRRAIAVFTELLYLGFSHEAIAEDPFLDPAMEKEAFAIAKRMGIDSFSFPKNDTTLEDESPTMPLIYEPLLARLLQIACFCHNRVDSQAPINDENLPILFERVLSRVFLWVDFCSLPQKVTRERTDAQYAWFKESLEQMGSIQNTMLSVLVEPTHRYFERAWCVAEYINTNQEFSIANTAVADDGGKLPLPQNRPDMETWLRAMVGPNASTAEELIQFMNLKITNNADADVVCAVVWSRVSPYLQQKAQAGVTAATNMLMEQSRSRFEGMERGTQEWVIARGRAGMVANYLQAMDQPAFLDYYKGWIAWKKRLASEEINEDLQHIVLLADSCVVSRPHQLLPTLQSMAVFLTTQIPKDRAVQVSLLSDYTEETVQEMKQQQQEQQASNNETTKTVLVAMPTSVFAPLADFVVLHHLPLTFDTRDLQAHQRSQTGASSSDQQCVVS